MDRATAIVRAAGLTADDFLAELLAVRAEVAREMYGAVLMDELERQHAALHAETAPNRGGSADNEWAKVEEQR